MIEFISLFQRSGLSLKPRVRTFSRPVHDALTNVRYATQSASILINRCTKQPASTIGALFRFIDDRAPALRSDIYLNAISGLRPNLDQRRVMFNAFNENRLYTDRDVLEGMQRLESHCDKLSIPVINRSEGLLRIRRSECADWLAEAGLRSPKSVRVENLQAFLRTQGGLEFPLLIREELDQRTARPPYLVRNRSELEAVPFDELPFPYATEYVETRGTDGYYRKYRYVSVGGVGIPFHMPICRYWEARDKHRIRNDQNLAEEADFVSQPDPNHELFQSVLNTLGLDYAAIDYSYTRDGRPIVWDINVTPSWGAVAACGPAVQNAFKTITTELLKFLYRQAGLEIPHELAGKQRPLAA